MTFPVPSSPAPDPKAHDAIELEWFARLRTGDMEAFEALFRQYVEPLCAFAYSYVASQPAAQEIVQDLFCRLWERRQTLSAPRNVHAYLYGAVRNRSINHLRNRRAEEVFSRRTLQRENERRAATEAPTAEQELEAAGLAEAMEQAIGEMSVRCREVFTLTRDQGLSYAEVATVLQISPKTVETHMGRALALLRRRLAPWLS